MTSQTEVFHGCIAVLHCHKQKYQDYESSLKILNLVSLHKRREMLCLRFAKKCLKIENFKKLFPLRQFNHDMKKRKSEKYFIKNMKTERYKKSAIPVMQKMLNNEELKLKRLHNVDLVTREYCNFNSISVKI